MVLIKEAIKYIEKKCNHWEIFQKKTEVLNFEFTKNKANYISSGKIHGIGVRVAVDKRLGFSYTDNINRYKECIDAALGSACINNRDPDFSAFVYPDKYENVEKSVKELEQFDNEDVVSFFQEFSSRLNELDKELTVGSSTYKKITGSKRILNSEGVDVVESYGHNTVYFEPIIAGDINYECGLIEPLPLDPGCAVDFGKRVLALKEKRHATTQKIQALFHADALGQLLYTFVNAAFNAEDIEKEKSPLFDNLGDSVFDKKFTLVDNSLAPRLLHTRKADDEGTPSQKTTLVKKGVIKNFIYDNYCAVKQGKKSTGNAVRSAFSLPEIGTTNLLVGPGRYRELVKEIDRGIYLKGLMGVHTMNRHTGDFSLAVYEGHYVKNGEVLFPVKDTMVSGNVIELLSNITAIGNTLKHSYNGGEGGVYAPEILFPEIQVIGTK